MPFTKAEVGFGRLCNWWGMPSVSILLRTAHFKRWTSQQRRVAPKQSWDSKLTKGQHFNSAGQPVLDNGLALWEVATVVTSCLIAEWAIAPFASDRGILTAFPIL